MTTGVRKQLRNFFISNLAVAAAERAAARAASHMHDGTAWHGVAWRGRACVFAVAESAALDFWRQVL